MCLVSVWIGGAGCVWVYGGRIWVYGGDWMCLGASGGV